MTKPQLWDYRLEQLYVDQDPDFVVDAVPHLLTWLDPEGKSGAHRFELRETSPAGDVNHALQVSWSIAELEKQDPTLGKTLIRFQLGKTLNIEKHTEFAAYGLAMVAISCVLKRRIVGRVPWLAPDLLLDRTPGALRGVEVAGRRSNGYAALKQTAEGSSRKNPKDGKRAQLIAKQDVVEAYLSLWCCDPTVSIWAKVKP
jgi:hypothetical protein